MTRDEAASVLEHHRMAFDLALASYAMLVEPDTRAQILERTYIIGSKGVAIVPKGAKPAERMGLSRAVTFRRPPHEVEARTILHSVFERMIVASYDATKAYAKASSLQGQLFEQAWFNIVYLLRRAYAHDGRWEFNGTDLAKLPLTHNRLKVTADLAGQDVRGWCSWWEGSQLCSRMILFVTRGDV